MEAVWSKRRAHSRRLKTGAWVYVRESWVPNFRPAPGGKRQRRSACPQCGASILTMRMQNGGWGHFEGSAGLSKIKHPCFDPRKGTSMHEDQGTLDLVEGGLPEDERGSPAG
jgi:hypothetical protein